jgi:hypothetical protein
MENLNSPGFWWLPSNPDDKVPGILTFSNSDGISLSLMGYFEDITDTGSSNHNNYPVILGVTQKKWVTLYEGVFSHMSFPGYISQEYRVEKAFIGAHFTNSEEMRFHKIIVEYSYLFDWAGLFSIQQTQHSDQQNSYEYQLTYARHEKISATTTQAIVSVVPTFAKEGSLLQTKISQSAIQIEVQEELTFQDWHCRFIYPLQNLLSLATGRPNSLTNVCVYVRGGTSATLNDDVQELPIEVIFSKHYYEAERGKLLLPEDMLFTLKDIESNFSGVLENWLKLSSDLDSVLDLFFSVQYSPRMYEENKFLNITQALESYHRRRVSNQDITEEEHNNRLEAILAQTPEEHRNWLKGKLNYSNEPSFRTRIKELIETANEVISPLVGNKKLFKQKVYESRNYYTHYDLSLKERAASNTELYWLTQTLSFLIKACFLRELGFTPERSTELICRTHRYKFQLNRRI